MTSDKPTKKAAKKTAKKAAKRTPKVVEKAADLLTGPTGEQVLADVHESIEQAIVEGREAGVPVLLGGATVSLVLEYDDATTPIDAVNQALMELALNGTRSYTFLVRDEVTQVLYAVQGGQILALPTEEE